MGVGGPSSRIWHSETGKLHSEAWHVGQITGDSTERNLTEDEYKAVHTAMEKEGWDVDDAHEWLETFCV